MSAPGNTPCPGMRGDATASIHDMKLAVISPGIIGSKVANRIFWRHAVAQQIEPMGAVKRIQQRLGCDRANAGGDVRNACADRKELARDGNSEIAGSLVARDDRPRHGSERSMAKFLRHPVRLGIQSDSNIGRAEALRRSMIVYMNDTGDPLNAYPALWAPFIVVVRAPSGSRS